MREAKDPGEYMNRKMILAVVLLAAATTLTGCRAAEVVEGEHDPRTVSYTHLTLPTIA